MFDFPRIVYRDLRGIETDPRSDEDHLKAAIEWLYRSQDVTDCDGSAAYYSLLTGWSGPYPETSGYIIPTLYDFAEYSDSDEARRRGERMARWLLGLQLKNGAFPEGIDPGPDADPSVFNTGQILFGLIRAYRETDDNRFFEAAIDAADWLISVQHPNGYWQKHDYLGVRHTYCSRVAWALLLVNDMSAQDDYYLAANNHLEWVFSERDDNYWFHKMSFEENGVPYLHTIAYTLRGLIEAGFLMEKEQFLAPARETANHLLEIQENDGVLKGAYNADWTAQNFYCLTGNAQMALIWLRLYSMENEVKYQKVVEESVKFLKLHQSIPDQKRNFSGAFKGSHPVWEQYMRFRFPNWAVKFFVDTMLLYID